MLPKHPDQYEDVELRQWVERIVHDQVEEGPRLDYKAEIHLDEPAQRREAAKDISSFANEIGGTLLYGIPEDRGSSGAPIPTEPYGIDPIPNLEQQLEDVHVGSIGPPLPESRIRKVELANYPDKVVYVVWTPESWLGPHMVEPHGDRRYYRRGQFRAVKMAEHEVRSRYERAMAVRDITSAAVDQLETGVLSARFDNPCGSHYLAYPLAPSYSRIDFTAKNMQAWLRRHVYPPNVWMPAVFGVQTNLERNSGNPESPWSPYARITRYGAVSVWRHTPANLAEGGGNVVSSIASIAEFRDLQRILQLTGQLYQEIGYFGPLRIRLRLNSDTTRILNVPSDAGHPPLAFHGPYPLVIEVDAPASDLILQPGAVFKQLADAFMQAFGVWQARWVTDDGELLSR